MKKSSFWLPLAASFGLMASAHADFNDNAWKQYVAYSKSRPKVVATHMATNYKVDDETGSYKSERAAGAGGEKPKWVVVDKGNAPEAAIKMDTGLAAKVAEHPNDLLEETTAVERVGNETLGGKEWVILKAQTRLKEGKRPVVAKIWVSPETGQPLKIEGSMEKVPMPMKDLRFTISYEQAGDATVLPKLVKFHSVFSIMFHSVELDLAQELSGWKPN